MAGAFVQTDSAETFHKRLEDVLSRVTGSGVYTSRDAVRQQDPFDADVVVDSWLFDIDLRSEARVVLYNPEGLRIERDGWRIERDGRRVRLGHGVRLREVARGVSELVLAASAKGEWRISRRGRRP